MAKRYKFSQDAEEVQGLLNKIDGLHVNQSCGCGVNCELENVELNDIVYSVITRAVNNLLNYYTKSETYTKSEVNSRLSAIHQFSIKMVDVLPQPSALTTYTLYLVPSNQQREHNITDEFITVNRNGAYVWEQIGSSPVDLSGYVTDDELNSVLSDYVTSDDFSNAISELSSRIDGLHEVKYIEQQLTSAQKSQARANIGAGTYSKPSNGIPASDLANGVIPDISQFITKTVNDLVNYYTKSETYTKQEVQTLIAGIPGFTYELVSSLPTASAETMWKLYLIPSEEPKVSNEKDEFITVIKDDAYVWEQIGSTAIDLSGYVTIEALNTALAGLNDVKYTAQSLTDEQKSQARNNIGATAPEVFWAEYGVTTATEIVAAFNAEKIILVKQAGFVYLYSGEDDTNYNFSCSYASIQYRLVRLNKNNNSWSVATNGVQITSSRVSTIAGNETNTALYPNTKAVADAIEAGKQIFWATYGETTATEVAAKVTAGVVVLCLRSNIVYSVTSLSSGDYITFGAIFGGSSYYLLLKKTDDTWQSGSNALENTSNKTGDIDGNKTSTTKYPTVKAVYDVVVEATDEEIDEMMESVLN